MVLRKLNAEEIDKRNNRQQGLLLLDYLREMGYQIGVSGEAMVITAPDGFQLQTSLELCHERVIESPASSTKAAGA